MKIAVMGADAVGCYHGGMLARAGHAVTLIGRTRHVEAVRRDGLLLETQTLPGYVPMRADAGAVSGAGWCSFTSSRPTPSVLPSEALARRVDAVRYLVSATVRMNG